MSNEPLIDWIAFYAALHAAEDLARVAIPATRERLERARTLIHAEFAEPLDLDALARAARFSRHHFLREFRREFEITPHQYLTRRRIEAAKHLLTTSDLSVTEVCMAVGFTSLGSFSTLFRRHVGRSPASYRVTSVLCPGLPRPAPPLIPSCFLAHYGNGGGNWGNFREAGVLASA